jgi:hypothetical protein
LYLFHHDRDFFHHKKTQIEEKKMRKVAILFLAHNGISQPQWWRDWRRKLSNGESKILFFGIMPQEEKGWIRIAPSFSTKWCDKSLVLIEQLGLQELLKQDPSRNIQHIFFVSGDTVPIASAEEIYQLPDDTWLSKLPAYGAKSPSMPFRLATQWKSYSRPDAEYIASYNMKGDIQGLDDLNKGNREEADEIRDVTNWQITQFQKKQVSAKEKGNLPLANSYEFAIRTLQRELDRLDNKSTTYSYPYGCPDEFWIPSILKAHESEIQDRPVMGLYKPGVYSSWNSPSPVDWRSWEERYGHSPADSFGLADQLSRNCDALFFRKITSTVPYEKVWQCPRDRQ